MQDDKLRDYLIKAIAKRVLDDSSILDIVETTLLGIDTIDFASNNYDIITFLMNFVSKYRLKKESVMPKSIIINSFVKKHESVLMNELKRNEDDYHKKFFIHMLICKLFSCGFVTFDFNKVLDPNSKENGIETIVRPLIEARNYGHLKLLFNTTTLKILLY